MLETNFKEIMMKKSYEKPELQVVEFDLKDNLMEDGGSTATPSITEGVEPW